MGLTFAEHLAEFARTQGVETGTLSKIALNPDQSKHLETARLKLLGLELDFVNLRSEEYAANSRIPTGVTFGTPLQDAQRRDITINALFYNVHTRSVEDFTEKGLEDLRNGIIRTPLPPKETFLDDPLRILRCIRFASRFGFKLVPEIPTSISDPEIQDALVSKVARDRVGEELSKMMKGNDPLHSIRLINDLGLYRSIFSVIPPSISDTFSASPGPESSSLKAATILQAFVSSSIAVHPTLLQPLHSDPTCKPRLFLATALLPYLGISYRDAKGKSLPAVAYVLRECLKLGTQNHFLDGIPVLFDAYQVLRNPDIHDEERFNFVSPDSGERSVKTERGVMGNLLREKVVHEPRTGSDWRSSLLFSLVVELLPICDTVEEGLRSQEAQKIIRDYDKFISRIEELGLSTAVDIKPLLDGKSVTSILSAQPGPWTGKAISRIITWQLENPEGTREECESWLREEHGAGRLGIEPAQSKIKEPASKRARIQK
ncbi:CCA tRNA nucleotidyltransferase, mitochondrial [Stygiomarasmius scandens]|uniref:CCA tRNA nucleotidyltransferase, mitochondrial n=1 Tax=Marasmiellus scandens TaxID=2682957 RepID=A0ABR1K2F1_9AGAR